MIQKSSSLRRSFLAARAAAFGLAVIAAKVMPAVAADDTAIHPFHYHASDSALADPARAYCQYAVAR
jgi:hypothetical protein